MNVKTFASMILDPGDSQLTIKLAKDPTAGYEIITQYHPNDPYDIAAFGDWKIANITAVTENYFELIIETRCTVVTE
ncbi:MAG: hypothetical protein LUE61_01530 [Clostridiales bacterium]|nr:hypothetical protein [Clostridiales bacterium]